MKAAGLATLLIFSLITPVLAGMPSRGASDTVMDSVMNFIVAPNGYLVASKGARYEGLIPSDIVAYKPDGTLAWTFRPTTFSHLAGFANGFLIIASAGVPTSIGAGTGQITAVRFVDGSVAWTLDVGGMVMHVDGSADHIYAVVMEAGDDVPPQGGMMGQTPRPMHPGMGSRSIVAISNSGVLLWRVSLD